MKKLLKSVLVLFLFIMIIAPSIASATVATLPFAGRLLFSMKCTCPADYDVFRLVYAAPFNNPYTLEVGALDWSPTLSPIAATNMVAGAPATYMYYDPLIPNTYALGDYYTTGMTICWMLTSYGEEAHCEPAGFGMWSWMYISFGTIYRIGTSLDPIQI